MSENNFVLITNAKQFGAPPEARRERVELPEFKRADGKIPFSYVYEMTAQDFSDLQDSYKIYNAAGEVTGFDNTHEDLRILAVTMRDAKNNRLFADADAAIAQLKFWPLSVTRKLVAASNKVASTDPVSAEKNSETTQSDSSLSS